MPRKKALGAQDGGAAAHRILAAEADIREGARALRRRCEIMRRIHDAVGDPPLRRHDGGFAGLARVVVGQQVSMASAEAIWGRAAAAVVPFDAPSLLAMDDAGLKAAGLSRGKILTLRAVARAVEDGLDFTELDKLSEEQVHERLTAIHGVGPWTADVFIMFGMGRADAWASGDLALALAAQSAFGLAAKPRIPELTSLAERWRPWRAVAALLLWAHYKAEKASRRTPPA